MTEDNTVLVVAVLAVIASLAAAGFSYYSLSNGPTVVGFATSTGTANLSITSTAEINFTTSSVDFGAGKVNSLASAALLDTEGNAVNDSSDPWTVVSDPLALENIGNVNVSLTLESDKAAAAFIGGTSPSFKMKVTDSASNSGACTPGATNLTAYTEVTGASQAACAELLFSDANDEIDVDVQIRIPYDAPTGYKIATITATGTGL